MIRIRHVALPPGLSAFVRRGAAGDLEVFVSDALDRERARSAVRLALRSFRSADSRTGLLPLPLALILARGVARIRSVLAAMRTHAVLTAAAGVVTAAAVAVAIIVVMPHQHGPALAGRAAPRGLVHSSAPARSPGLTKPGHAHGATSRHGTPPTAGQPAAPAAMRTTSPASPRPGASQTGPGPRPSSPQPSTSGPTTGSPSPAPSPSPSSSGGGGVCVVVLGVWVCLG